MLICGCGNQEPWLFNYEGKVPIIDDDLGCEIGEERHYKCLECGFLVKM